MNLSINKINMISDVMYKTKKTKIHILQFISKGTNLNEMRENLKSQSNRFKFTTI